MRILFTGGGSGGHIFPIVAVAREIKKIYSQFINSPEQKAGDNLEMFFLGANGFSQSYLEKEGIKVKIIYAGKIRRYASLLNLVDIIKIPIGLFQSLWSLFFIMPEVIFSKGGYGSIPVAIVGWIYHIPIILHESDSIPGLANRIVAKFSKKIIVSFAETKEYFPIKKTILIGNPIRSILIDSCLSKEEGNIQKAKEIFKIESDKPIILIIGGSQGAQGVNKIVQPALESLLEKYEIIHQCGERNYQESLKQSKKITKQGHHLFALLNEEEIAAAYLISNLIISRAGAGSIFEIINCQKPSILIPLPNSANNHQQRNAFITAELGISTILEEANSTPHILINEIEKIMENPEKIQEIKENTKKLFYPQAAKDIAESLIKIIKK